MNNLFEDYGPDCLGDATDAWKSEFVLNSIPENGYLCIAINGRHGEEKAWAGIKVDGEYVGCPDMAGKKIEAWVLTFKDDNATGTIVPEVWMSNYPHPFCTQTLEF